MKRIFRKLSLDDLQRISVQEYQNLEKIPIIVVLDNVRSAQNVGSVFRTSDAFCIEKMYVCGITAQPPHKEIHKTALGAQDSVPWEYCKETGSVIETLKKEGWYICSVEQAEQSTKLHEIAVDTNKKYVLIFGNEVSGVQQSVIDMSDECIEIPQFGTKHSFNISVSCGIVLWDIAKCFLV
ncbi:MAG: RNA methyltransferase [Bacteroidales bacterium]|nr:RNA methyltransferase [Bacteroidales bacterium]